MNMYERSVSEAINWQAEHAEKAGAAATGRVVRALLPLLNGESKVGQRMREWKGLSLEDAMPLRITGGFHNLVLTGVDVRLSAVYSGEVTEQHEVDAIIADLVREYDARLLKWFDGPPQTNEAGRSAAIMAGLMWLGQHVAPKFQMFEIGASAGVNTMMERYHYNLGGVLAGPEGSPMRLAPEWRGPPPPMGEVAITAIEGCDQNPVDLRDEAAALRLKSYVWPEMHERMARIDAAIALAKEQPPKLRQQDAVDYVHEILARPQEAGTTKVLFHSIVWQYISAEGRAAITNAMEAAGERATSERPLAWVMLETNRETMCHELRVRYWAGSVEKDSGWHLLGAAHPHGAWVEWYS